MKIDDGLRKGGLMFNKIIFMVVNVILLILIIGFIFGIFGGSPNQNPGSTEDSFREGSDSAYFAKGDKYIGWKKGENSYDSSKYPREIKAAEGWGKNDEREKGIGKEFASGWGAALYWPTRGDDGAAYVFKGERYIRWDIASDERDLGPEEIAGSDEWGEFESNADAAVYWPTRGKVYFFKGDSYSQWDVNSGNQDFKGENIESGWGPKWGRRNNKRGMPERFTENLDAAVYLPDTGEGGSDKIYIFKGNEYVRWDVERKSMDKGYPKNINTEGGWPGLWNNLDAALYWPG
ncbi:MAG: hemopexin repeat-containing protein [Candidatus Nanohaloarchaea archaeon]|nr:hemopexin repeat-containing protein [Candidatus Nanohaloarchaea archaeon]